VCVCVCVCLCLSERKRERERLVQGLAFCTSTLNFTWRVCVCVCECVCACVCVCVCVSERERLRVCAIIKSCHTYERGLSMEEALPRSRLCGWRVVSHIIASHVTRKNASCTKVSVKEEAYLYIHVYVRTYIWIF